QIAELYSVTSLRIIDKWIHRLRGGGFIKRRAAKVVRYYTALVELVKESPDAPQHSPEKMAAIRGSAGAAVVRSQRGLHSVFGADQRQRALLASLATALAAERFRRDTGRWPDALAELVPAYVATVPTDPYDFQPLRYRRLDDGVVTYALGPDELDGGG